MGRGWGHRPYGGRVSGFSEVFGEGAENVARFWADVVGGGEGFGPFKGFGKVEGVEAVDDGADAGPIADQ